MKLSLLVAGSYLLSSVNALHFYFESSEKRCFLEELPSDTMVEGHYRALLWDEKTEQWKPDSDLGILINVEDLGTGNTVVNTRAPHEGSFRFTSHDKGDHNICLSSNKTGGWLGGPEHIKMYLDVNVGSVKVDDNANKVKAGSIAARLQDVNRKVADIQREQRYMREVEASFRDASEAVNSRAAWYVLLQIAVLVGAGFWQMKHLKVYFEDKKLR